jgi:hypothetical protein
VKIKAVFRILIILLCLGTLYPAGLIDVYKKGVIKIIPDPNFGKGIDWESLFFDAKKDLLVAPDGSVFVCNNRRDNFYKFNPDGKLVGTYGRSGRGPGDLYFPGLRTCLDGKYLVFNEYAEIRKISLFDFSGKCIKTLRTKTECFDAIGLKNSCIAYYSHKYESKIKNNGESSSTIFIHIISMNTKNEIEFSFGVIPQCFIKTIGNGVISPSQSYLGDFIMTRTKDGNFLVGITNSPVIKIFSPEGKLIKTFQLNIKPIPVTGKYIEKQKEAMINGVSQPGTDPELAKQFRKSIEKSDFENLFGEYLPYYKTIVMDSEGNFLVFKWLETTGRSNEIFQVYSPEGKYICETILDKGVFDIDVRRNFQTMQFTGSAFYGIVQNADDEEIIRLVRVKY